VTRIASVVTGSRSLCPHRLQEKIGSDGGAGAGGSRSLTLAGFFSFAMTPSIGLSMRQPRFQTKNSSGFIELRAISRTFLLVSIVSAPTSFSIISVLRMLFTSSIVPSASR
jgi:hypothetical protein